MATITIPSDYGYVLLTATSLIGISQWHSIWAGSYRKAAKITYPNAYAPSEKAATEPAAYAFNCAQRAHANFIENFVNSLPALLIGGLQYPKAASVLGAIWGIGRIVYAVGYANSPLSGKGKGRYKGSFYYIGQFGLYVLTGLTAYNVLMA